MSFPRRILKESIYKILAREPILNHYREKSCLNKIVVLMYHEIANDDDEIEAWTVVKKGSFIRQMEYLVRYFDIVSLEEAIFRMENSKPIIRPTAVVTFDDGYRGNGRILTRIVESMKIPVTVFVSTKAVEEQCLYWYDRVISAVQDKRISVIDLRNRSLGYYKINRRKGADNWKEIERLLSDLKKCLPAIREIIVDEMMERLKALEKEASRMLAPLTVAELRKMASSPYITIGAHSHCQSILTQLSKDEARDSVEMSKKRLELWIGRKIDYFSYPNGDYDDGIIGILKDLGFKCGITTVERGWEKSDSIFEIPRIAVGRYDSFELFQIKVSGNMTSLLSRINFKNWR